MKFYLLYGTHGRAQRGFGTTIYKKINHAIAMLKKQKSPYRLCADLNEGIYKSTKVTLMIFEGISGFSSVHNHKLKSLLKVGTKMFVPKALIRKTTRKRKTTCKKSKSSVKTKVYAKSTLRDSNSHS